MVVNPDDASGFDGQHAHPELAPSHAFDLGAKINRDKLLRRHAFVLCRCRLLRACTPGSRDKERTDKPTREE
jgi:hypothetical protein